MAENNLLEYWERCFLDGSRMGPAPDKFKEGPAAVGITRREYLAGKISSGTFAKIVAIHKANGGGVDEKYPISLLISPYVYRSKAVHQQKSSQSEFSVLCIPASMSPKDGKLSPKPEMMPFVPRRHLAPMGNDFATIGDVDKVDEFLTTNAYSPTGWDDTVGFGKSLANAVITLEDLVVLANSEYLLLDQVIVMVPEPGEMSGGQSIQRLYADIGASKPSVPLLTSYSTMPAVGKSQKPLSQDIQFQIECMQKHLGQMNCEFSLSESQRIAIHHHLSLTNGDITAINGPPGTGKTTLLQSVVATAWVSAAINGSSNPPVMVACSTNNQAVTNIIESFGSVSASPGVLGERWLPEIVSYGLYCVSGTKETKPEYQREDMFPGMVQTIEYLEKARRFFMEKAAGYYGQTFKDSEAVAIQLKKDLKAASSEISSVTDNLVRMCSEKEAALKELHQDKLKALLLCDDIQRLRNSLERLQTRRAGLLQKKGELHNAIQAKRLEAGKRSKFIDSLANEVDKLYRLSNDWAIFSRSMPFWINFFGFLQFIRDKWVLRCLQFYEINEVRLILSTDVNDMIMKATKSVQKISQATLVVTEHFEGAYNSGKDSLKPLKEDLDGKWAVISRLETEHQEIIARLTAIEVEVTGDIEQLDFKMKSLRDTVSRHRILAREYNEISVTFDQLLIEVEAAYTRKIDLAYRSHSDRLDIAVRSKMFSLATHYWESQWIKEMREGFQSESIFPPEKKNIRNMQSQWRRYAKLTPLFVATFHMAPTTFVAWKRGPDDRPALDPLYNYIDLLIVDESGQVGPDVAAPTFALAKKAFVVGDLYQIEPVWSVNEPVDKGNMRKYWGEDSAERYSEMGNDGHGVSSAAGSVMRIAQMRSTFRTDGETLGLLLREHTRCAPQIIGYCNELAYKGKLVPCRKAPEGPILPFMGWAHISGTCEKYGDSSRINTREAEVIVAWIDARKSSLEQFYGQSIEKIVAVVTPFNPQAKLIRRLLKANELAEVTAGTVHTLQGAQRKVVILSTVYDIKSCSGTMFFDDGINMLNVAVSRAIDSFLVFGDTRILDRRKGTPSGRLAKFLFASPDNEITDLPHKHGATRPRVTSVSAEAITTLEGHRQALMEAITTAKERIIIASPWVRHRAIQADSLLEPIQAAISRGVSIFVYTDKDFNLDDGGVGFSRSFTDGADELVGAGVEVRIVDRVHNKDIVVDSDTLICGSFNWLSAVREEDHFWSKKNSSLRLIGGQVSVLAKHVVEEMEFLFSRGGFNYGEAVVKRRPRTARRT